MRLYDLAKIVRSKNSGPFEITLDILFDNKDSYDKVKNSNILTKEYIAKLYKTDVNKVTCLTFYDQALGIKATLARKISSGTCKDRDVYGAQQYAPLANIKID
ncbi:MAG: DUF4387 domain-containing protein [Bacillota bacterium]|jgi:hypothetical protein|nr:DUF4387 domain-containing protein [Bacillota bacterium]MDD3297632.1 DUF4387 domain-containing protein [Bacillota bacterium]MDD3850859.1 DUF4387 domain-containing protein [Bacillota bacterium]MDD4707483.1 DUF4387 domain-containing protein [Bacillota bacterium]